MVAGSAGWTSLGDAFHDAIHDVLSQDSQSKPAAPRSGNDAIGVGIIGLGGRGSHLLRSHGFWPEEEMKKVGLTTPPQEPLPNVKIRVLCDVYRRRALSAIETMTKYGKPARGTREWRSVIDDPEVDAVFIATPDVWHGPIALAAIMAGKHVYVEKCMTNNIAEAKALRSLVRSSKCVLQVGHQNRHSSYHQIARRLVKTGVLGDVSVVQTALGRNSPDGAYAGMIPPDLAGSFAAGGIRNVLPNIVDWDQFYPAGFPRPTGDPNPDWLVNWRKYWAFGTGIAGDLLSHETDIINMIFDLGVPDSVTASGGIYCWKDGREIPDTYSVVHEYKDKGITFTYNATLANSYERHLTILGKDATCVVGFDLSAYPDFGSKRYASQIASKTMSPQKAFVHFEGPVRDPMLKTSPTLAWADGKGLTFTDLNGKRADVTRIAIEEFYDNIRFGKKPKCSVDDGFEAAVACHMGTLAFRENRVVKWDRVKEEVI